MQIPEELRYTAEHEWVRVTDGVARVGITDHAQAQLGDIVFVQLPEDGTAVSAGETLGEVESTKSVSDLFAPVGGTVAGRNPGVVDDPALLNSDPYGEGWLVEIRLADGADLDGLLDAQAYRGLVGE